MKCVGVRRGLENVSVKASEIGRDATVSRLQFPSIAFRNQLASWIAEGRSQESLMISLPCMTQIEYGGNYNIATTINDRIRVGVWNIARGYFLSEVVRLLDRCNLDVVLLSEVDYGMARTGQCHVAHFVADALGMNYAFGTEFVELNLGNSIERVLCAGCTNTVGLHGNAILCVSKLDQLRLLRLEHEGCWSGADSRALRVGTRCAIAGRLHTVKGDLVVVSVHLEGDSGSIVRAGEMRTLLDAVQRIYGYIPVLIGGDLNTPVYGNSDLEREALYAVAVDRGFKFSGAPGDAVTTRSSDRSTKPPRYYKSDWFVTRGLEVAETYIFPAIGVNGEVLSDHELLIMDGQII